MSGPRRNEKILRAVAAFSEAGSDMCGEDEHKHARDLYEGAHHIFANARLLSHAGKLLEILERLMADYATEYYVLTDGEHGRTPGTPAWKAATRLVKRVQSKK